ncbi:SGNH/GDSL hydrolase family protein [Enterococcus gallinarum]|uniref:SGNH/GDSL hydrolase family protein n=1 Tax=Enterococcus gallinarum TaxID=1353 RepID=UPI0012E2767C|nr:SGNH/GDSL hydrolase family protein [Enterococcus gallinarum]MEB6062324.1 SGNH/GDSL hydrolase family protein [Enterococcus gallinarum]MUN91124.1 SGNH hydrolase [Enterococcus gallinarum]
MLMSKKDRLLFVGDSITDSNRNREAIPAGWSSWGDGYVNLINAYTTALLPNQELMVVNRGNSGDTIIELEQRWQTDVLDFQPDWVTIMIGINDVWRHFDGVFSQAPLVDESQFEQVYRSLIEQTISQVKGLILLSPFMVEQNKQDPMRNHLTKYQEVVQRLAQEYQLLYGDVQQEVDRFLIQQSSYVISSDRVHPSLAGHVLIAKTWLETVESEVEQ